MSTLSTNLPAHDARSNFYQMLDEVGKNMSQFSITHRGKTRAVLLSSEEYESWQETLDIISDEKLMRDIQKARTSKKVYAEKTARKMMGV